MCPGKPARSIFPSEQIFELGGAQHGGRLSVHERIRPGGRPRRYAINRTIEPNMYDAPHTYTHENQHISDLTPNNRLYYLFIYLFIFSNDFIIIYYD